MKINKHVASLLLMHGNVKAEIGDFFKVSGKQNNKIILVGDLNNIKVFVHNTVPGDTVEVKLIKRKKRFFHLTVFKPTNENVVSPLENRSKISIDLF